MAQLVFPDNPLEVLILGRGQVTVTRFQRGWEKGPGCHGEEQGNIGNPALEESDIYKSRLL